jgi:Protein of unknown function (DUF1360)
VVSKPTDAVREEADKYRHGEPRPLGGYTALLAIFAILTGVVGAVAALTGTRLRRISPYELFLVAIGTHKLARLVTKDAVTSPLRVPFTRYREAGGPSEVMEEVRVDSQAKHAIGELITCPFCLSVWIAGGFSIGLLFAPAFTRFLASTLTAVTGADFLQLIYAHLQQVADN